MTGFDFRPSRPIAFIGIAVAFVLIVFGVFTFAREGFGWFALLWLAAAVFVVAALTRRVLRTKRGGD